MSLGIAAAVFSHAMVAAEPPVPTPEEILALLRAKDAQIQSLYLVEQTCQYQIPYTEGLALEPPSGDVPWNAPAELWWQEGKLFELSETPDGLKEERLVNRDGDFRLTTRPGQAEGVVRRSGLPEPPPVDYRNYLLEELLEHRPGQCSISRANNGRLLVDYVREGEEELSERWVLAPEWNNGIAEALSYFTSSEIARHGQDNALPDIIRPGVLSRRSVYRDYREAAPGVWMPFEVLETISMSWDSDSASVFVEARRFLSVTANEPIPPSRFTLPFPRNTPVTDYSFSSGGRPEHYTVGPLGLKAARRPLWLHSHKEKALITVGNWLNDNL
jgi:hypothetical protein